MWSTQLLPKLLHSEPTDPLRKAPTSRSAITLQEKDCSKPDELVTSWACVIPQPVTVSVPLSDPLLEWVLHQVWMKHDKQPTLSNNQLQYIHNENWKWRTPWQLGIPSILQQHTGNQNNDFYTGHDMMLLQIMLIFLSFCCFRTQLTVE